MALQVKNKSIDCLKQVSRTQKEYKHIKIVKHKPAHKVKYKQCQLTMSWLQIHVSIFFFFSTSYLSDWACVFDGLTNKMQPSISQHSLDIWADNNLVWPFQSSFINSHRFTTYLLLSLSLLRPVGKSSRLRHVDTILIKRQFGDSTAQMKSLY